MQADSSQPQRVAVVGAGYVGLVTAACLAQAGHETIAADVDGKRIADLQAGRVPFHEPGLSALVAEGLRTGGLRFLADVPRALAQAPIAIVAVGTPKGPGGQADLAQVERVVDLAATWAPRAGVLAVRSTVPPGTGLALQDRLAAQGRADVQVVSVPEFLSEGTALRDFQEPERLVFGGPGEAVAEVERLFAGVAPSVPRLRVSRESAEAAKYASNVFLAARVSLVNEVAAVCDAVGADVRDVARIVGLDPRVGSKFLRPGLGYGGACFPKDVQALSALGQRAGLDLRLVPAIAQANSCQLERVLAKAKAMLEDRGGDGMQGACVALWGLAFKPGTSDTREAPALALAERLAGLGARVRAHDPQAVLSRDAGTFQREADPLDCCTGADLLILATEWADYAAIDPSRIKARMRAPRVLDARNHLDGAALRAAGFAYAGVGLGATA